MSVYNAGRLFEPDGDLTDIYGYAEILDLSDPGKLIVVLDRGVPGTCMLHFIKLQDSITSKTFGLSAWLGIISTLTF